MNPNWHKAFDKNSAFSLAEVKNWKQIRKEELDNFFSIEYATFDELKMEKKQQKEIERKAKRRWENKSWINFIKNFL